MMDARSLRSMVLSIVKPLKSGKAVEQSGAKATLDNLNPSGSDNRFTLTSPFGFISKMPKGVTAFYQELFGSGFEPIALAFLHALRPEPLGVGESILYSTDSTGKTVKIKITLGNDGKLVIDAAGEISITSTANVSVQAGGDVTVKGASKALVSAANVEIGEGALEKIVAGETFMSFFNEHTHQDGMGLPTTPPMVPMEAAQLSATVKAAK
ncbi:MAG: hypothetical protein EOP06_26920 [Proteobacteria bacterium]|nr:MAG: hypothetical protein EOP06_26920 [Pseudomonadota bacterium]